MNRSEGAKKPKVWPPEKNSLDPPPGPPQKNSLDPLLSNWSCSREQE